jgi:hydrogenase maturation factor
MEQVGKINLDQFISHVLPHLGAASDRVVVPPMTGVDAGVVDIGNDQVMIIAEDPIFPAVGLSWEDFGFFTTHIGASDVAVMGVAPQFMTYSLLLPPQTPLETIERIVKSISDTARDLGIAIVGGHTGYYPTVTIPIIGGVTVFSTVGKDEYVTPAGAKVGDKVILTKGPAIEATGLLSVLFESALKPKMGDELYAKARGRVYDITVVKDAITAKKAGRVTAMHDATEGGVIGALYEVANASHAGMKIDESRFILPKEVEETCRLLEIDSLEAISEGSLVATVHPDDAENVIAALAKVNIEASIIGEVVPEAEGKTIRRLDGSIRELSIPAQDPFWPKFFEGVQGAE